MNIFYLSDSRVPSSGADSVHVMKMCNALARNGHCITLFCYLDRRIKDPFRMYGLERSFGLEGLRATTVRGVRRLLRVWHVYQRASRGPLPDLFYGRDSYGLAAVVRAGRPVIFEAHTPPRSYAQQQLVKWLMNQENFVRLVVISESLRREYQSMYPHLNPEDIVVAHDAADPVHFDASNTSFPSWPGRDDALQLGYVGSLYEGKGAEIVAALAARAPDYDFHIVGDDPKGRARIGKEINARNLFFHGRVEHRYVASYLAKFDVVLFPGQEQVIIRHGYDIGRWTSPMKLFEYMAAGKSIIASRVQSTSELLQDSVHALLVPASDLASWKRAIDRLANDAALRASLGNHALEHWRENFTWKKRAERVFSGLSPGIRSGR